MEQQPEPDYCIHHTPSLLDDEEDELSEKEPTAQCKLSRSSLQASSQALRQRLQTLRAERRRVWEQQQRCDEVNDHLLHTLTALTYQQQQALVDYTSAVTELQTLESTTLAHAQQWNVTASDAFYIACEHGTVATINGLRLGAESVPAAVMNSSSEITPSTTHSFFPFAAASTPETATLKIPWREINAALGQVALLLATLEQNLSITTITSNNSTTKPVFRYELQCMGSTSKIGLRRPAAATAFYNLYYEPEAFQFFAKRNFNTALQCLLECVQDAAAVIQERDPTIVLPYAIQHTKRSVGGGSTTVGGLSLAFFAANDTNDAQQHAAEWTRACKYLLTNMKHLMVFRAVGLWTNRQL